MRFFEYISKRETWVDGSDIVDVTAAVPERRSDGMLLSTQLPRIVSEGKSTIKQFQFGFRATILSPTDVFGPLNDNSEQLLIATLPTAGRIIKERNDFDAR